MVIQEFFDKWNSKGIDFDSFYGFQCMDLAHQFAVDVNKQDIPSAPAAKDVWNKNCSGYDKIKNTPEGVPQKGDIVIWGTEIGQYGHIAVFDHGDSNSFTSFDQNWPVGSLCHYQNHSYKGVLGWLRIKSAIITQPTPQPVKIPLISEIYQGILGVTASADEIKAREDQLDKGVVLHDVVSQILNEDGRSPLVILKKQLNEALTAQEGSKTPSSLTFNTLPGKFFYDLAQLFG